MGALRASERQREVSFRWLSRRSVTSKPTDFYAASGSTSASCCLIGRGSHECPYVVGADHCSRHHGQQRRVGVSSLGHYELDVEARHEHRRQRAGARARPPIDQRNGARFPSSEEPRRLSNSHAARAQPGSSLGRARSLSAFPAVGRLVRRDPVGYRAGDETPLVEVGNPVMPESEPGEDLVVVLTDVRSGAGL